MPWPAGATDLTICAAASLTDALKELQAGYQKQTGDILFFNFGASSTLARQIEAGAPADVFFSADEAKMDALEAKGLILKQTRTSRLANSLVIIVAADRGAAIRNADDLATPKVKRLALAEPRSVPAGIYAKAYLQKRQLWENVAAKVVPTENVRAALAAVESGNVEAGIVYKTDAAISRKVKVACAIPPAEGPDISYPVAVLKSSQHPEAAQQYLAYLNGPEAARVFERLGFVVRKSTGLK